MSNTLENSLKSRLAKLQCHFTWNLMDEDVDVDKIKARLDEEVEFLGAAHKYRTYNLLAYTSFLTEDHKEAAAYLRKAEDLLQEADIEDNDAKRTILYGNHAWMFYHRHQFIKGFTYVKKAQEICKRFESSLKRDVILFHVYSEQGFSLLKFHGRHSDRAKQCFQKALELDPENSELNSSYAISVYKVEGYNCLKKPLDESFPLLKQALKTSPNNTLVKVLLALKYQDLKDPQKGLPLVEEALRETPEFLYQLRYVAKFYRRQGMVDEAILVLNQATRLNPTSSHLHYQLSKCYKQKMAALKSSAKKAKQNFQYTKGYTQDIADAVSSAIFHLEKAVALKNHFILAYVALASMYGRAKQYDKAEETFHRVLTMDNVTLEEEQELHLNWGQYEQHTAKRPCEALRHYKEVLKIQSPTVYREYAIAECKNLAKEIPTRHPFDDMGADLLDFIHEQDIQMSKHL